MINAVCFFTDNSAGPLVVWFRSDEGHVGRGFLLQYEQNPCAGPNWFKIYKFY